MIRVGVVSPEPTPYRAPLFDRLAARPGLDLTVIYAAETVAARQWRVEPRHPHIVLHGRTLPTGRLLGHDYPVTPRIWSLLSSRRFDCLVVAGWSLFASQAAVAWARVHRVPYVITSESQLLEPRAAWKHALKRVVLPRIVAPAAGWLVTGSLARDYVVAYGADPVRVRIFANTVDTSSLAARAEAMRAGRDQSRAQLGLGPGEIAVLYVGRLVPQKGIETLVEAVAEAPARLVLVGDGPLLEPLRRLAPDAIFAGFLEGDELVEAYVAADVFALLSTREPWGVVVNEAAAAGLPLVLSETVGAAADLLRPGENGLAVPAGDSSAAAAALRTLAGDAELRRRYGARSRELALAWGYEPSVDAFELAVREAVERR